jgi:hypothetical protein
VIWRSWSPFGRGIPPHLRLLVDTNRYQDGRASRASCREHRRRLLAEFSTVVDAVRCAVDVQRRRAAMATAAGLQLGGSLGAGTHRIPWRPYSNDLAAVRSRLGRCCSVRTGHRIAIFAFREYVDLGPNRTELSRRAADYVIEAYGAQRPRGCPSNGRAIIRSSSTSTTAKALGLEISPASREGD